MEKGTRVRLSDSFKALLIGNCIQAHTGPFLDDDCLACSSRHVAEFGNSTGVVLGLTDFNNHKPGTSRFNLENIGPEVDVRWEPENLRYSYLPEHLTVVE